jgi:hypothetical protein
MTNHGWTLANAGLPDGLFSNPNPNFGSIFDGLEMEIFVIFYGPLVCFTCGHLVHMFYGHLVYFGFVWYVNFFHFGMLYKENSGNTVQSLDAAISTQKKLFCANQ